MFDLNDTVELVADHKDSGLLKGDIGVIVEVFGVPEVAYEVEFLDEEGNYLTTLTLLPQLLAKVKASD